MLAAISPLYVMRRHCIASNIDMIYSEWLFRQTFRQTKTFRQIFILKIEPDFTRS